MVPETVREVPTTALSASSEVSLVVRSVAVALTISPAAVTPTAVKNVARPVASVATLTKPR